MDTERSSDTKTEKKSRYSKSSTMKSAKSVIIISFQEMKNVFDLIESFAEANRLVILKKANSSRLFADFTDLLEQIMALLDKIPIHIEDQLKEELLLIPKLSSYPDLKITDMTLCSFFKINSLVIRNGAAPVQPLAS